MKARSRAVLKPHLRCSAPPLAACAVEARHQARDLALGEILGCARCNKDLYQTTDAIRMGGGRNPKTLEEFFRESAEFFVTGGQ